MDATKVRYWRTASLAKYGLTEIAYEELLEKQGGVCAICRRSPESQKRRFCVDHDHVTGAVRGILCYRCNFILGHSKERVDILYKAIAYLKMGLV